MSAQSETVCTPHQPPLEPGIGRVRVCNTWTEVEELCSSWTSLLEASPGSSIFQTPEWLGAWWQSFGGGKELFAFIFYDLADTVAGLALFYVEEERFWGRPLKVLRMVGAGSGDSDALDFITARGYEKLCAEAFVGWMAGNRSWDICALETIPQDSLAGRHVAELVRERGWKLCRETSPNFFIPLPRTWQEYLEHLEPSFRPLLTRYPKRLQSRYRVRMTRCEREQELDANLQTLFALHQMRWTGRGEPGAFSLAARRDFYRRMARAFLQRGWLEFWLLELEGEVVATQFCFRYGATVSLLQEGFHPQYAADRVGYALRARVLEEMIRGGVARYDFLGGDDAYKLRFGARQESYLTLRFAGASSRGRSRLAWRRKKQQIRQWLKHRLPERALAALRGGKRKRQPVQPQEQAQFKAGALPAGKRQAGGEKAISRKIGE